MKSKSAIWPKINKFDFIIFRETGDCNTFSSLKVIEGQLHHFYPKN